MCCGLVARLDPDRGDFADFRRVVAGHALKKECVVRGVGCLYLVPDGSSGY